MEKIDVGITAIVRPEILRRTMETFYNYVIVPNWNYEFRAVVHVDALGPHNTTPSTQMQEETAEVVKEFMQVDNVQLPVGPPSQHTALGRVWFQAKEEFMLHLEDDWIFHKPVFLMPCIDFLKQYPAASGVMFDRADCSV